MSHQRDPFPKLKKKKILLPPQGKFSCSGNNSRYSSWLKLPPRYFPFSDVVVVLHGFRSLTELLRSTNTATQCPFDDVPGPWFLWPSHCYLNERGAKEAGISIHSPGQGPALFQKHGIALVHSSQYTLIIRTPPLYTDAHIFGMWKSKVSAQ